MTINDKFFWPDHDRSGRSGSAGPAFHNTLNYVFTANIEEVMKFYNLFDKTFEKDFNVYLVDVFVFVLHPRSSTIGLILDLHQPRVSLC